LLGADLTNPRAALAMRDYALQTAIDGICRDAKEISLLAFITTAIAIT
jgi:hypothetical protein